MIYTIDNPKKIDYYLNLKEHSFTGVAKDTRDNIGYFVKSKYHREDGPAVIWADGSVYYFKHGKRHREDGPAIIRSNGTKEYWVNHVYLNISTDQELQDYFTLRIFQ